MRLIDADRLLEPRRIETYYHLKNGDIAIPLIDIEHAPIIEERKKGEWIITSEFEDCRYAKCNQCKVTQVFYYNKPLTNFCPDCGADMMKGEEHG